MEIYDPASELFVADPEAPLLPAELPDPEELRAARQEMILSASGWRTVFAAGGDEESESAEVGPAHLVLAAQAALAFADFLQESGGGAELAVAVGCDSRPTGPAIADAAMRMLIASGLRVEPLFITAAPEIMAYVKSTPRLAGFMYISASHNPVGHNGIKFGLEDGAVAGGEISRKLIERFRARSERPEAAREVARLATKLDGRAYAALLEDMPRYKGEALARYTEFTGRVAAASDDGAEIERYLQSLREAARRSPIGILAELNGSARCLSIDRRIFEQLGILYRSANDRPRQIAHRIVPEGESLTPAARLLEEARRENPAFTIAYVPDNDGDRGNLVYFDTERQAAVPIPAQQLFALTVMAELTRLAESAPAASQRTAVVVNGPTSMRIEEIARRFGAEVYRCEVGEANVVERARKLREAGYRVRILGEGSNGGNITHPATVRDPLNTLFSVLQLLLYRPGVSLTELLAQLPAYRTTSAYEPEAKMQVRTTDHALLKSRWEQVFLRQWRERRAELAERFGITDWREVNYEGIRELVGFGPDYRSGDERGGLKIVFSDAEGRDTDFIWMRGSGTEPVFRVLADSSGDDPERERYLLEWQREMIEEADGGS
jgi:phosphomannomutase